MPKPTVDLERAIAGALRGAIKDHGPITLELIASAAKRVAGNLVNARIDEIARTMARRRWADVDAADRSRQLGELAKGRWASMSAAERSEEMRRRRRKGLREKKA